MTIPTMLKIGGHSVTVSVEDLSKEGISGDWNPEKNLIRIASGEVASQQESTLFHEILHVCNSELDTKEFGHVFLESISQQLYQVLADNHMLR